MHRIGGRIAFTLIYLSCIGALVISPHAFGGSLSAQSWNWTASLMTGFAVFQSWRAIRNRQIAEHRKWAFRAMFWMGSIILTRILIGISAVVASWTDSFYTVGSSYTLSQDDLFLTFVCPGLFIRCSGATSSSSR